MELERNGKKTKKKEAQLVEVKNPVKLLVELDCTGK